MLVVKKISARRRVFVFTLALFLIGSLFFFANLKNVNVIKYDLLMTSYETKSIQRNVQIINNQQTITNEKFFGPLMNNSVIIVVQVHKRITYLRHLIVSLAQARDISNTLLIFSHDFYDEEINELIQSIDFCKVMQIFYPFSIQMHPNEFPGTDPKDCKRDMKKEQALEVNCYNSNYPDLYGHYREAAYTQMKHHWWWKLNRVFDQLEATRHHTGLVLLLEEDYYVSPDFLHVLDRLQNLARRACTYCNILTLGSYSESISSSNFYETEISPWITSKHNMGMAFNRLTWREVKTCSKNFCDYDDYNYDWSFQNINYSCLKRKLYALIIRAPRVFHIGKCGMHHNSVTCDSSELISKVQLVIETAANAGQLFPKNLKLSTIYDEDEVKDVLKPNGGWSDLRDILLCLNMSLTK